MAVTDQVARVAPYVEQLLEDDQIQKNMRRAANAGRRAYRRARRKRPAKALTDRRVQRRVRDAMQAAGEALSGITRGAQRRRRARRVRTLAALAIGGGGLAVALNSDARRRAMAVFGGEDGDRPDPTSAAEGGGSAATA